MEPGEVVPRRLPDLFAGSPLLILGRYRGHPAGTVTIQAMDASGEAWSESIVAQIRENPAIAAAWARGQVRQLEDRYAAKDGDRGILEKAIVAISLRFQVLCRFTAYVAIDRSQIANKDGSLHRLTQPVEQPEGWDHITATAPCAAYMSPEVQPRSRSIAMRSDSLERRFSRPLQTDGPVRACSPPPPCSAGPPSSAPILGRVGAHSSAGSLTPPTRLRTFSKNPSRARHPPSAFRHNSSRPSRSLSAPWDRSGKRSTGSAVSMSSSRFSPRSAPQARGQKDFRQELELMSRLSHPAIVPIFEVVDSESEVDIVMPFVSGRPMTDWVQSRKRMDPRQIAELVAELADALQLIHGQGLIHADLKPDHILIGDDGRPRLLGFGDNLRFVYRDSGETTPFTPAYAAPEQIQQAGRCRDVRVDVYGLGVVLYELLTGKCPFEGRTIQEMFQRVLDHKPVPPRRLVRSIPAELEAVCLKAMARNPDDRYPTAAELAAALRDFLKPRPRKSFWK